MDMLDVLVRETAQVERLVREADLAATVDACPGWTVYDLVTHLGAIHRWASAATRIDADVALDGVDEVLGVMQPVATVAGDASTVLLLLWGRLGPDSVSVEGDRDALDPFLRAALTP